MKFYKIHKRFLSFTLTLIMLLTLLPTTTFATTNEGINSNDTFSLFVNVDTGVGEIEASKDTETDVAKVQASTISALVRKCGDTLTWSLENGILTINGSGKMFDYTRNVDGSHSEYVDTPWYIDRKNITQIVIEDGVTTIGANAFADCANVTNVVIANSVTHIGENAFEGCGSMDHGILPMNNGALPRTSNASDAVRYSVMILDTSGSMGGTPSIVQKQAAIKFCKSVLAANGQNYVAIVRLNTSSSVGCQFTDDLETLTSYINSTSANGGTNINQALTAASDILESAPDGAIKNIVLCSDGLPEHGTETSDGPYTSSDGDDYYRYANAVYNTATLLKAQYKIYSLAFFHSLSGEELALGRKLMKDVQNAGYYEVVDPNDLEFTFGEIADDITTDKKTGSFWYASGDDNDYSATFYYDDKYFSADASEYNESLATMSLCLALSAFGSNRTRDDGKSEPRDYTKQSRNAQELLEQIGFDKEHIDTNEYFRQKPAEDTMGVIVGHKPIDVNGKKGTLIALATRGGGYEAEWAGNFTIGISGRHEGFSKAVEEVKRYLSAYVEAHMTEFTGPVKIWMAGYSRAAATVNMVAADLTKTGNINGLTLDKQNIYAYCFEPPMGENTSNVSKTTAKNYTNIHNIVNPNDLVTKVAMRDWGFVRYGKDEPVIPTQLTSSKVDEFKKMFDKFVALDTDAVKESIVKDKAGEDTHIINTFQAKKLDPNLIDANFEGHWEKRTGIWGITYYVWVQTKFGIELNPRLVSDTNQSMSAFLDSLITSLSIGLKNRIDYTTKLQPAVRVAASQFMGKGYEAYKWDKVPDIFATKMRDHTWDIAKTFVFSGHEATVALVTVYLYESISEAGIDLYGYASIPTAFKTAIQDIVDAFIASIVINGGNDLITLGSNIGMLFQAHYPELCLAWMQMQDPNYTPDGHRLFVIDCYRIVHINCPVDVDVYDSQNQLVAQIINDVPQDINGSLIVATYTSDGEKLIYLPADEDYRIEMRATDNGTVNYSVTEYSYDTDAYSKIVNYYDIPVKVNATLTGSVDKFSMEDIADTGDGSSVQYALSQGDSILAPTNTNSGESAQRKTYLVTAASENGDSGAVIGGGAYTEGAYAQVSALPYNGCTFLGWYKGDTQVSTEQSYRFRVETDTDLTAKFDGTRPTVGNGAYELTITAEPGGTIKQGANGYYAPGSQVTLMAEPNSGYVFTGWIADGGTFSDVSSTDTTFTMPAANVTVKAVFRSKNENAKTSIKSAKASLKKTSYIYNGKKKRPSVTVKIGSKKLKKGVDYKVTYKNNRKVGTATVIINGIGKYKGKLTKKFKIIPKGTSLAKITAKSKGFTVSWRKQAKFTNGYQIQYSTSKKFKKYATVAKTVKKSSKTKLNIKKCKAKQKYYIRIRTYKTVKGKKYYSSWSKTKIITTKK